MGMGLSIGYHQGNDDAPDEQEEFAQEMSLLNDLLAGAGLPRHVENLAYEFWCADMVGFRAIPRLKRLAATIELEDMLPAPLGGSMEIEFDIVEDYFERGFPASWSKKKRASLSNKFEHLLWHNDVEGYYVPVDFERVLYDSSESPVTGEFVGSCQRLLVECKELLARVGAPEGVTQHDDMIHEAISSDTVSEGWLAYAIEVHTCLIFKEAAELSIAGQTAIVLG